MGTLLLTRRSWPVHLVRGRPGGRFGEGSGGRPTDCSTWHSMDWCAGVLTGSLASCLKTALRPLVIRSDTCARSVRKETSRVMDKIMPPDSKDPSLTLHVKGFDGSHVTGK